MARVAPFKAVHYNTARFGKDVTRFVAPPYDVIDPRLERRLKEDRLNIAHITLGDEGDSYRTAAKRLRRWLNDNVLVRDADDSLYVYDQAFVAPDGQPRVRSGIVCMVRLEEITKGVVMPHERTMPQQKTDRLSLLSAVRGHTEQVFMLYDDPSGSVEKSVQKWRKREEMLRFVDTDGVQHRLVKVVDPETLEKVRAAIRPLKLLIADGHHRYATSVEYSKIARAAEGVPESVEMPYDYVLADLISKDNPGVVLYPVHRLVRVPDASKLATLPRQIREEFETEQYADEVSLSRAVEASKDEAFGLWLPGEGSFLLALPKDGTVADDILERLSVRILQEQVFKGILGFTQQTIDAKENIEYVKGTSAARALMATGEFDACFFVKAPEVGQVMAVAESGRLMPQKSTYFYPKIWSGAVLDLF